MRLVSLAHIGLSGSEACVLAFLVGRARLSRQKGCKPSLCDISFPKKSTLLPEVPSSTFFEQCRYVVDRLVFIDPLVAKPNINCMGSGHTRLSTAVTTESTQHSLTTVVND